MLGVKIKLNPSRIKRAIKDFLQKDTTLKTFIAAKKKARAREKQAPKVDKRHGIGSQEWVMSGRWVHVKSSNVEGIKFDYKNQNFFVEFQGKGRHPNAVYIYYNVPTRVAKDMFNAASMGKFVWRKLRGKYNYARIK